MKLTNNSYIIMLEEQISTEGLVYIYSYILHYRDFFHRASHEKDRPEIAFEKYPNTIYLSYG